MTDPLDAWRDPDLTPARAREIQAELAPRVVLEDRVGTITHVLGADVAFPDRGRTARAAVVVLAWPSLEPVEEAVAERPTAFPYVPGLLAFREMPPIMAAMASIGKAPDAILCDGHGLAHPRRFGLACHVGLVTGIPTIGVAKSRYVGEYTEPARERGARTPLVDRDETVGAMLRTRTGVRPVFVSPGHLVDREAACRIALECAPRYRVPEPIRRADRLAPRR